MQENKPLCSQCFPFCMTWRTASQVWVPFYCCPKQIKKSFPQPMSIDVSVFSVSSLFRSFQKTFEEIFLLNSQALGLLDSWALGFLCTWALRHLGSWPPGLLGAWAPGNLGAWAIGLSALGLLGSSSSELKHFGYCALGPLDSWAQRPLGS
jgi:hypothetical protein